MFSSSFFMGLLALFLWGDTLYFWTSRSSRLVVTAAAAAASEDADKGNEDEESRRCVGSLDGLGFEDALPGVKEGLKLCRSYSGNTCCEEIHTNELLKIVRSAEVAEFSAKCVAFTERVLCSACDPAVGVRSIDGLCLSICNEWYDACSAEFWEPKQVRPFPCLPNALVCSPLNTMVSSGEEFCALMNFPVAYTGEDCYDGSSRPRAKRSRSKRSSSSSFTKSKASPFPPHPMPWEGYELAFSAGVAVAAGVLSWRFVQQILNPAPRHIANGGGDDDDDFQ